MAKAVGVFKARLEARKQWLIDNWDQIKSCYGGTVYDMMVNAGLYSKNNVKRDIIPVVEQMLSVMRKPGNRPKKKVIADATSR